jgi:putative oxidoreductase
MRGVDFLNNELSRPSMKGMDFLKMKNSSEWGIFLIRVTLGIIILMHGLTKWADIPQASIVFTKVAHLPMAFVYLVAIFEVLSGIFLILGCFVRISSIFVAILMISAVVLAKIPTGSPFIGGPTKSGIELDLIFFAVAISLILTGSNKLALYKKY